MPDRSQLIEQALGVPADVPRRTAKPPLDRRSLIDQALGGAEPARPSPIAPPSVRAQPKREIVVPEGSQAPSQGFLERTTLDPAARVLQAYDLIADYFRGAIRGQPGQPVTPEEMFNAEAGLEERGPLAATIRKTAGQFVDPLMFLPPGMGAIRRLLPEIQKSTVSTGIPRQGPRLLEGPPGELRYVEEPPEIQELQTPGYPLETKRGMTKFEAMPGPPAKSTEFRPIELEGMPEISYEPRPMEPSETLVEDALAAMEQLTIGRQEKPGRIFVEGQGMGGTPERVIGIPSGYPDWYRQLTTGAEGVSGISRKTIDAVLEDIIRGRPSHPSRRRARGLVTEAIQGVRHTGPRVGEGMEDVVQVEHREPTTFTGLEPVEVEEPSTLLVPHHEVGTEWTRGTLTLEIPKGHYEWVANGSGPKPTGESLSRMPREVISGGPEGPPPDQGARFSRWWGEFHDWWRRTRGQELPIVREVPASPVISGFEGSKVMVEDNLHELLKQPWARGLQKLTPEEWKAAEDHAVKVWEANGRGPNGYQLALDSLPPPLKEMLKQRDAAFRAEQEARQAAGLPLLRENPSPYFPRVAKDEWNQVAPDFMAKLDVGTVQPSEQIIGGAGPGPFGTPRGRPAVEIQTGIGGFGKHRYYPTMLAGEAEGLRYVDPMRAFLFREVEGAQMRETIAFVSRLKADGILHDSPELALAASPTGKVYRVKMGEGRYLWARTLEEGKFLQDNWTQRELGSIARAAHFANVFIRNPSLVNPFPHATKNMAYKYGMAALAQGRQPFVFANPDYWRYLYRPETIDAKLVMEFQQTMPFSKSGMTVYDLINQAAPSANVLERAGNAINVANRWAAKKIFAEWDPAMRFALWKQYRDKGLSAQEAANHVWLDLVRYGARSQWIDMLKSIPTNFFVPWRVGTVRTTLKAMTAAPVRVAMYIGLIDLLREMDYRQNGRWTHLPIDYLERPMAELIRDPKSAWKTMAYTLTLGPGGEYSARTIETMLKDAREGSEWKDVERTFWGLAQIYDVGPKFMEYQRTGELRHLADIAGLLLLGRHEAKFRPPGRLLEHVPESLLPKSAQVKADEQAYEARQKRKELRERRRELIEQTNR